MRCAGTAFAMFPLLSLEQAIDRSPTLIPT
jgi:hypothetical protein